MRATRIFVCFDGKPRARRMAIVWMWRAQNRMLRSVRLRDQNQ
ncbi:hypothetical protein DNFV4_00788 [Nitrospira tepida]|uniref:Uncharacterized protein n=1 Tax=Nitrospira tepida TaxID=2973512 RepID=A0AA86MWG8_9BACT|nr:hypothetical protein DNFV4_00788 [Nitrospira tepida]